MVGEIRDTETMETAIEAALTGHLVLSTLHTNSAVATVTRLLEMGVEPYLLASAITAASWPSGWCGRSARRARSPIEVPVAMQSMFGDQPPERVYKGMGCQECRGTGFLGRLGIYELLILDDDLRRLMHEGAAESKLLETARGAGMQTLREECLDRVRDGSTTLEEVMRATLARTPAPIPTPITNRPTRARQVHPTANPRAHLG